jgi:hypothetical protein
MVLGRGRAQHKRDGVAGGGPPDRHIETANGGRATLKICPEIGQRTAEQRLVGVGLGQRGEKPVERVLARPLFRLVGERQVVAAGLRAVWRVDAGGHCLQRGAQGRIAAVGHARAVERDDRQHTATRTVPAQPLQEPQALVRKLLRDVEQQHHLVG